MDINSKVPSALKETWSKVAQDGKIDKKDYDALVKAAAPTQTNKEFDQEEIAFLGEVKDKFKNSDSFSINQGNAKPNVDLFTDTAPESIKPIWDKAASDGKITKEEYGQLIKAVAPNGKNDELDEKEISFLNNLRQKFMENHGEDVIVSSGPEKPKEPVKDSSVENIIDKIINSKDKSSTIQNINQFSKAIDNMDNRDLVKTASILKKLLADTDNDDPALAELQQMVLDKIK